MKNPQAAVLGCAHYPLLEPIFQEALGSDVKVFSQAEIVAESLVDYLTRHPEMKGATQPGRFVTTGDPAVVSARATQFLKQNIMFEAA